MSKQTKITRSARGRECQVRSPVCSYDSTTVVYAHLNGGGIGTKAHQIHGAYACHSCHQWLDGVYVHTHRRDERDLCHLRGVIRTQIILLDEGLITT